MKIKNLATILGFGVLGFNNLQGQNHSLEPIIFNSKYHSEHTNAIEQYEPYNRQEISLDSNFNILNAGLKEYLNKIYIVDQKDFFDSNIAGHAHPYGGIICLTEYFTNQELFHEASHIRNLALDEINSDFSKKWKEIANFEYGEENIKLDIHSEEPLVKWKDETIGPKDGLMGPYSAKNLNEDIATFVGYSLAPEGLLTLEDIGYIFERPLSEEDESKIKSYAASYPFYFADTTDHRYKQKLDLLKEYNFFTKEEHEKLSNDLGSLRYLLKKEE